MLKRIVFGGAIALVVVGILVGTGMFSYVRTSARIARSAVKDSVPITFQIERARDMIADLDPVINENIKLIAREEVELTRLEQQISNLRSRLSDDKSDIMRLQADLKRGDQIYVYAGRNYSTEQVKNDLANRFERYKTSEGTLASLEKVRNARQRGLEAAREKLAGMKAAKTQLVVDIQNLQARMQMVEAEAAVGRYHLDEGRLGDVQKLVDDLDARLQVAERLVQSDVYYPDQIPLQETGSGDIVDRVADYFGTDRPEPRSVAQH